MKPKLLHRLLYSVFGGIPASYFVWLGSTAVVAQADSSAPASLFLAASAAATVAGWLVILGLGSSHRLVRWLLTVLISVGVAIAVAFAIFAQFGLVMLPALVGIFLLAEMWSDAQLGIQADTASPRRLT